MSDNKQGPSQVTGQLKSIQGQAYQGPAHNQAVGAVLPEALNPESWTASGTELQKEGEAEIRAAKVEAEMGAVVDSAAGKLKSATGYLTGDQSRQTEGNLEAEKASVDYKQAKTGNPLAVPIPSAEGVKGKMESVAGMVTGDQELQKEGNAKAEAAAWKDGN